MKRSILIAFATLAISVLAVAQSPDTPPNGKPPPTSAAAVAKAMTKKTTAPIPQHRPSDPDILVWTSQ